MKYSHIASWLAVCSCVLGIAMPFRFASAEVFTTTLGETHETPDSNFSVDIKANRTEARRGEKVTYTLTVANASQTKTITTDLGLIFYNLDLNVASIQPKQFSGRLSNISGYPWNFFFKSFQLKPLEKKTITFTAAVNSKAKIKERLRMTAVVDEAESRNTEINQVDTVYVTTTDGPARSEQTVRTTDIPNLFKSVYGRTPTDAEKKYWIGRMKDKPTTEALKGAMSFQKAQTKTTKKVLGSKSNDLYEMTLSDRVTKSAPGELVPYSVKVTNKYSENTELRPQLTITAKELEISSVSDKGRIGKLANGKSGGTVEWNYLKSSGSKIQSEVKIDTKKSHTFTFKVKTPTTVGSEYCVKANIFPFLDDQDCNTVAKATAKKVVATPTPKPTPAVKITTKEFRITGPTELTTKRSDQNISWYVKESLQKQYPNVKIELCPGKDFKNCVILEAIAENDGGQIINMPPVPRIGKWYLHIIGRDENDGLVPKVSASQLVVLTD